MRSLLLSPVFFFLSYVLLFPFFIKFASSIATAAGSVHTSSASAVNPQEKWSSKSKLIEGNSKYKQQSVNIVTLRASEDIDVDSIQFTMKVVLRAMYLSITFSPVILTTLLACISDSFKDKVWFRLVGRAFAFSGAAFIKWGQWASTRPDMFPEELCIVLSSLQSDAPQHSYYFSKISIEAEFDNLPIDEVFEYFNPVPIASGSIAQVHRAVYKGQDVAVKIRHPNVYEQIKIDFIIMKFFAECVDNIPGLDWLNLSESMIQFSATIASQTRLDVEGAHLNMFNENFNTDSWKDVAFPKPIFVSDSVLIETFERGESVATFAKAFGSVPMEERSKEDTELAHFIVSRGEDLYLKMLIQDNLMHADMHPGNILIQQTTSTGLPILKNNRTTSSKTNSSSSSSSSSFTIENKIVLVDAGMVAILTSEERYNFIGLLEAIGEGAGSEAAFYVMKFSNTKAGHPKIYPLDLQQAFSRDMDIYFKTNCKGYGTKVAIGEVLRGILGIVRKHRVSIDANYATLVMNALCLDGLAQSLLPTYNIIDGAKPLLKLNRFSKRIRLPHSVINFVAKVGYPIGEWFKMKSDRKFLSQFFQDIKKINSDGKKNKVGE